jgi:hypothetical protein
VCRLRGYTRGRTEGGPLNGEMSHPGRSHPRSGVLPPRVCLRAVPASAFRTGLRRLAKLRSLSFFTETIHSTHRSTRRYTTATRYKLKYRAIQGLQPLQLPLPCTSTSASTQYNAATRHSRSSHIPDGIKSCFSALDHVRSKQKGDQSSCFSLLSS